MLLFKTDDEFKGQLAHDIEWNKKWIKGIQQRDKTLRGWSERTSDADNMKSIKSSLKTSADAIKAHRDYIAHAQEIYEERYGQRYGEKSKKRAVGPPGLTVIRGGKKGDDGLSREFRASLHRKRSGPEQHPNA